MVLTGSSLMEKIALLFPKVEGTKYTGKTRPNVCSDSTRRDFKLTFFFLSNVRNKKKNVSFFFSLLTFQKVAELIAITRVIDDWSV